MIPVEVIAAYNPLINVIPADNVSVRFWFTVAMVSDYRAVDRFRDEWPVETPGYKYKEALAPAGTKYMGYIDGDQAVAVKK